MNEVKAEFGLICSSRRRHTRLQGDWSSDVCSSDLEWFLHSGIQQPDGGVARYYLVDAGRNLPASTEITGYAISAFVYLHSFTHDARYLDRALSGARFLARAWDAVSQTMPFEIEPAAFSYFFDCGIVDRKS